MAKAKFRLLFLLAFSLPAFAKEEAAKKDPFKKDRPSFGERLKNGANNGALTDAELKELRAERDEFADFRKKARKDGEISKEEREQLKQMRKELNTNIRDEMNDNQMQYGERLDSFTKRIQAGISNRTLTEAESKALTNALQNANFYYEQALGDDGKIDDAEREMLGKKLNELNVDIREERRDTQGVDQDQLDRRKEIMEDCGYLTVAECREWKELKAKKDQRDASE